jgi:inorganic pyrophosphatase
VQRRGEHRLALLPQPQIKTRRRLANLRNLPPKDDKFSFRKDWISKMRVNTDQTTAYSAAFAPHPQLQSTSGTLHFMSLSKVTPGKNAPDSFNVIIEIPMDADPVKYEVDKETGAIFVDRFMSTSMHYPTNYGYVPKTLSGDGDPVDVLVITPVPLIPGVVVTCRAIGILKMTDEAGEDGKVLAVPIDKILSIYSHWKKPEDMNPLRLKTIAHFFEHYKDLEENKWVKINGWEGPESAKQEIVDGMANYAKSQEE